MTLGATKGEFMGILEANLCALLEWLLKATLQGSVLVCLILLTKVMLRDRLPARWHYCLWLVLLVRLILPWAPQSRLSIYNLIPRSYPSHGALTTPAEGAHVDATSAQRRAPGRDGGTERAPVSTQGERPQPGQAGTATAAPVVGASSNIAAGVSRHRFAKSAAGAAPWLWLAGCLALGGYILLRAFVLWSAVRSERPVTNQQILDLLEDCKLQMRVRTLVGVVVTDRTGSPALFGFVRPRILLPEGLVETLGLDALHYVFLHELAHLRRRDIYLGWLICFLQALHWFNPIVWYAFRRMRADQEMAADALALSVAGTDESRRYGRTIVNLLECFSRPEYVPSLAGILENPSHIERRVKMIAEFKSPSRRLLSATVLLTVLGLVTLTDAQSKMADASKSQPDKAGGRRQPVVRTVATGGQETGGILSPDETMIAYVDWENPDGSSPLMVKELESGQRHVLAESELIKSTGDHTFAHPLVWSPDAKWLAYRWHGEHAELKIVPVPHGGSEVLKAYDPEVEYSPEDWSLDGKWILCVLEKKDGTKALGMVSRVGGQVEELASFGESSPAHARFSPDGKWVVYECAPGGNRDVYAIQVQTKQIQRLTDSPAEEGSPVWSLDGNHIVFSSNRRGVWDWLEIPMEPGRPVGAARLLKYDFGDYRKRVTRAGNIAFNVFISNSPDVYSLEVNPTTGESMGPPVRLTKSFYGQHLGPAWSPDGKRIAYIRRGGWMLCIQTIATGQEECIRTGMSPANHIFWSPDGKAVALTPISRDSQIGVFYFPLSSRQLRPIVLCPNFSPKGFTADGKEFVLYKRGNKPENVAVDVETGKERKLMLPEGFNSWTYDYSRDQARIAFVEREPNASERRLIVSDRDFKDKRILARAKGLRQPRWSPDGARIAFLCDSGNKSPELRMVAPDGHWQTKVNTGHFKIASPPEWSPDGRKLALTLSEGEAHVSEIALLENPFSKSAGRVVDRR
jgi:bla regulator protein BlaR1